MVEKVGKDFLKLGLLAKVISRAKGDLKRNVEQVLVTGDLGGPKRI